MVTEGRTVSPKEVMMAAPTLDSAGISELLLAVSSACCCVQLTMDRADSCQAGSTRNTTRAKYYRIPCRRTYGGTHSSALSSMSVFSRLNAKNRFRDLSTRTAQKLSGSQPTILGYLRPKLSSRPRDSDMSKLIQGFTVSRQAWRYCHSLRIVKLPDTVVAVGHAAFQGCYSLMTVEMPGCVELGVRRLG